MKKKVPRPKGRPAISALIYARNEEQMLPELLKNLEGGVDEVLLIDGESTDATRTLAKKRGARVIVRKEIAKTKEGAVRDPRYTANQDMRLAKHDWILTLDADERLTPQLKAALPALIADPRYKGYRFGRRNFFNPKRWARWGGMYPDYQLRLFDRRFIHFPKHIHTLPPVQGAIATPNLDIVHLKYRRSTVRAEAQKAVWRLGEPEEERNPFVRVPLFAAFFAYFFIRLYLFQLGFLEPEGMQWVTESADYYSRFTRKLKKRLRALRGIKEE